MPNEPQVSSGFIDATGQVVSDLSLLSNMSNTTNRELRAIRILLGAILTEMNPTANFDTSEFTGLEAMEG